jgi:hypothetical protein
MNNYKNINVKNLKKGVMYFIEQKGDNIQSGYFDRDESVKYVRFKNSFKSPFLVSKKSKFYYPHKNSSTRRNSNNNNSTRKNKPKRTEFEPTPVTNWK